MKKIKYILFFVILYFVFTKNVFAQEPSVEYSSHVSSIGWMNYVGQEQVSGTTGRALQMEALKIKTNNLDADINYRAHVSNVGWMKYIKNNEITGTTGRALQMEAIQIVLTGKDSLYYDVYYRVHVSSIGWMNWLKNDQIAGTTGRALQIEAIQIKIVQKKGIIKPDENPGEKKVSLNYKSYVSGSGWQDSVTNGQTSGTEGKNKAIEVINLNLNNSSDYSGSIMYETYNSTNGWTGYKNNGNDSGSVGKKIEAIRIKLTDKLAENYNVYYRTHVSNLGWLGWTKDGSNAGTAGYFYQVEAIQIKVEKKNQNVPDLSKQAFYQSSNTIECSAHVSNIGWMNYVKEDVCGTTGKAQSVEAIKIKFNNNTNASVNYESYIQGLGWQPKVSNNQVSGTTGFARYLEAIKISLSGNLADYYDIYYRTHVSEIGWLDWAKNGEKAGSVGNDTKIEAIQIKLVRKGSPGPTNTTKPYVTGRWEGSSYINYFGKKVTDFKYIDGVKYYFNNEGTMIGKNVKKVIDVSSWQGKIDWNKIKTNHDVDAAILRVGWGMSYDDSAGTDSYFDYNVKECQRLGIPYSLYIYGYAKVDRAAKKEAQFVVDKMKQYNIPANTYVWYDAEINEIPLSTYNVVIPTFINYMKGSGYSNVGVYGSLNNFIAANGNLNSTTIRSYPLWVAQYYKKIQYPGSYVGWQYTSDGYIDGINGRVDVSMFY